MAPSFVVSAIAVVAQVLPFLGIHVGTEELQTTVTTLITIVAGLVVLWRQVSTGRSTIVGTRPK